jgi:1-acyl-sn-glycerol-3-phosphate acyltransferase
VEPRPTPSLLSRLVLGFLLWLYRRKQWHVEGTAPRRCVIIGAPHTSGWDFVFFLGATHELGIRARFMGKQSLFRWPLKRFMLDMGGVPVDRSSSRNYVEQMVAEFAAHDDFVLVIAPEGTRKGVSKWRSGFYHIAQGAGVPIVCGWLDLANRRGGIGVLVEPSGDQAADMAQIAQFYRSVMPDHPKLAEGLFQAA